MTNQEKVHAFMTKHNFVQGLRSYENTPAALALWHQAGLVRASLIAEELSELQSAWAAMDPVGVADAVADLLYVVYGAAVNVGIGPAAMQAVFDEVHASNMTKQPGSGSRNGGKPRGDQYRAPDVAGVLAREWGMKPKLFQ